jgi:hypothetical protein
VKFCQSKRGWSLVASNPFNPLNSKIKPTKKTSSKAVKINIASFHSNHITAAKKIKIKIIKKKF